MKTNKRVAISAAVMVLAAQAMSASAKEAEGNIAIRSLDVDIAPGQIISKPDVKFAMHESFPSVVTKFEKDGVTIKDRYEVAQNHDFTSGGASFHDEGLAASSQVRCHSACHGAGGGYC